MQGSVEPSLLIWPFLVAAALLPLLWVLHKKLRIFTRGTVTFMVVVLIVTTILSLIDYGNEIRNNEVSARQRAQRNTVIGFVRGWLQRPDVGEQLEGVDAEHRHDVDAQLLQATQVIRKTLGIDASSESVAIPTLVCLRVERSSSYFPVSFTGPDTYGWVVDAVVENHREMAFVRINISTVQDVRQPCRIVDVKPTVDTTDIERRWKSHYRNASAYRNPEFEVAARSR